MKKQIVIPTVLFILATMITGCTSKHTKGPKIPSDNLEVRIYEVFGMDCPGCHGGVENLVSKIPAVQSAQANWKEQRLVVVVGPGSSLDDELVYDAIRRSNFTPGKRLQ
jgi:hypothetical protein